MLVNNSVTIVKSLSAPLFVALTSHCIGIRRRDWSATAPPSYTFRAADRAFSDLEGNLPRLRRDALLVFTAFLEFYVCTDAGLFAGAGRRHLVYYSSMTQTGKFVRQSVSIPVRLAKRVRALAKNRKTSANRVLLDLIEAGLESKEAEKQRFFALTNKLAESTDSEERQHLKEGLARMTFGD